MTATVMKMSVQRMVCDCCGAEANASCNCGVAYHPAVEKLARKLEQDRQRSRRAYEKKKSEQNQQTSHVRNAAGLDDPDDDEDDIETDVEPDNYRTAYMLRADQARRFASYSGPVTQELIAMARQVATVWSDLAKKMEKSISSGRPAP